GIEGCLLRIPLEKDPALIVRVLPGVLVDKEIYLFDSRLGLPVPGPGGKGTVTLTQLRQDPVLLSQFTVDGQHPYDITPEQVKQAEVLWYCSLSALAPRMKLLETLLPEKNKVRLATDHVARLERVRAATLASGTPVRTCDAAGRALPLARLLRYFLPASDGGVDPVQSYPVHMLDGFAPPPKEGEPIPVLPSTQLNLFHLELAPWKYF